MRAQLSSCGSAVDSSHLIVSILVLHVLEITSFWLTEINKSYFKLVQLWWTHNLSEPSLSHGSSRHKKLLRRNPKKPTQWPLFLAWRYDCKRRRRNGRKKKWRSWPGIKTTNEMAHRTNKMAHGTIETAHGTNGLGLLWFDWILANDLTKFSKGTFGIEN